jgi:hypothetical protein
MSLTQFDIYNGTLSVIFIVINVSVGLIITSKYFKFKDKNFIYVGLSWIGISCPYIAAGVSFLAALVNYGVGLPDQVYFFIGIVITPIFIILWNLALIDLLFKKYKKVILYGTILISLTLLSIFLYGLFFYIELIGTKEGVSDTDWSDFVKIYFFILLFYIMVTGLAIAWASLKSEDRVIKTKGRLLATAFVLLVFGGIIDAFLDEPITRVIMMISAILFYFGWIMPEKLKEYLRK